MAEVKINVSATGASQAAAELAQVGAAGSKAVTQITDAAKGASAATALTASQVKSTARALSGTLSGLAGTAGLFAGPQVQQVLYPMIFLGKELKGVAASMKLLGIGAGPVAVGLASVGAVVAAGVTGWQAYKASVEEAKSALDLIQQQGFLKARLIRQLHENEARLAPGQADELTAQLRAASIEDLAAVIRDAQAALRPVLLSDAAKKDLEKLGTLSVEYFSELNTGFEAEREAAAKVYRERRQQIEELGKSAKTFDDKAKIQQAYDAAREANAAKMLDIRKREDAELKRLEEERLKVVFAEEENNLERGNEIHRQKMEQLQQEIAAEERRQELQRYRIQQDFRLTDAQKYDRLSATGLSGYELGANPSSMLEQMQASVVQILNTFGTMAQQVARNFQDVFMSAVSTISSGITSLIMGTQTWGQALRNIGVSILTSVINAIVQMGVQWIATQLLMAVVGKSILSASVAATAPLAAAQAAIWATPATLATISSYGGAAAAAPGLIAIAEGITLAQSVIPRELGGPVTKGQAYIVGEKRPEIFVPDTNGRIIPSISGVGPASSGGSVAAGAGKTSFNVYPVMDRREILDALRDDVEAIAIEAFKRKTV